jgi:hypothetical protein
VVRSSVVPKVTEKNKGYDDAEFDDFISGRPEFADSIGGRSSIIAADPKVAISLEGKSRQEILQVLKDHCPVPEALDLIPILRKCRRECDEQLYIPPDELKRLQSIPYPTAELEKLRSHLLPRYHKKTSSSASIAPSS